MNRRVRSIDLLRHGWAPLIVAFVVLSGSTPATGQPDPNDDVDAMASVEQGLSLREHEIVLPSERPNPLSNECDAAGEFTVQDQADWFRFREDADEHGCGEIRFELELLPSTNRVTIRFAVDRIIEDASDVSLPANVRQELHIYHDDELAANFPYFPDDAARVENAVVIEKLHVIPAGVERLAIAWYFHDRGDSASDRATVPLAGQAFTSTVRDVLLSYPDVPLSGARVGTRSAQVNESAESVVTTFRVDVPTELTQRGTVEVRVLLPTAGSLTGVITPKAVTIDPLLVSGERSGAFTQASLGRALIEEHGPGAYLFQVTTVHAVVQAAVAAPMEAPWLFWASLVPVLLLYVYTGVLLWRLHHNAVGAHRRLTYWGLGALVAVIALGATVLALVPARGGIVALTSLPLSSAAIDHYLWWTLTAFAAAFVTLFVRSRFDLIATLGVANTLERKNAELQRYAAATSHDLKGPLATMDFVHGMLEETLEDAGIDDAQVKAMLGRCHDNVDRMRTLISDLLDYARLGAEQRPRVRTDLKELVEHVLGDLEADRRASGASVTLDPLPFVSVVPQEMQHVFQNLIANAFKFRHPDRAPSVSIRARREDHAWRFTVSDNGIGIPLVFQRKIFGVFERAHASSSYPGTGIGLAMCKKVVEQHAGRIWVVSKPGQGSAFHFTIPDASRRRTGRPWPVRAWLGNRPLNAARAPS